MSLIERSDLARYSIFIINCKQLISKLKSLVNDDFVDKKFIQYQVSTLSKLSLIL